MNDRRILTAESVTEGHPDKLCDAIADGVLDACLAEDPGARMACEVLATVGKITVAGEITARVLPDIPAIAARTVRETGCSSDYEIEALTHEQSPDIAEAVYGGRQTGAGDQGVVYGYACLETDELLPLPVVLAHRITRLLTNARKLGTIRGLGPDGKAQVSVEYLFGLPSRIVSVVASCQHDEGKDLEELRPVREGRHQGGPERGLHGPVHCQEHCGGGAGGEMYRLPGLRHRQSRAGGGGRGYPWDGGTSGCGIGAGGGGVFDLTPEGMIRTLGLDRPIFTKFCNYGHFTHPDAPWERMDKGQALDGACRFRRTGVSSR